MDDYLDTVPEPQRSTLQRMREHVHALYPDVEECSYYNLASFRIGDIVAGGFAATRKGCSWYPMSGSVLDAFDVEKLGYSRTKGALQFAPDTPLPKALVGKLLKARLQQG